MAKIPHDDFLADAHWGIVAKSLKDGQVIWSKGGGLHFVPASNLKLFTTAAALLSLGPDYRYVTTVRMAGEVEAGTLHGDLVVRASGDPSLSPRFRKGGAVAVFEEWADLLASEGVLEVGGGIVIDESLFDAQYMGTGWFWDDEPLPFSAQIGAFSINDNCVELKIWAGAGRGEPVLLEVMPETSYVTVVNRTRTAESGLSSIAATRPPGTNTIVVSGTISSSDSPKVLFVSVHNPSLYGATVLREVLESRGIHVHGGVRIDSEGSGLSNQGGRDLLSYSSPPLSVIVRQINKWSHNLSAELLLRSLGAVRYGKGSERNGVRVVEETLQQAGIVPEEISISDGSGLSRLSIVTPMQIVDLLEFMYHHPTFPFFYDSLPVAGVDGTLAARMVGTPAANNVKAKTGSATHISCLSGYVRSKHGELIAFSMLTNNNPRPPSELRGLQDRLCEWLSGR